MIFGLGDWWLRSCSCGTRGSSSCWIRLRDSAIERFSSTKVSYLFDVATVYVYSSESAAITVGCCGEGS